MSNEYKPQNEINNENVTELYETIIDYITIIRGLIQLRSKEDTKEILNEIDSLGNFIKLYLREIKKNNAITYRDALTNAFNREYLTVKLSNIITNGDCTVLMVDIDKFKKNYILFPVCSKQLRIIRLNMRMSL